MAAPKYLSCPMPQVGTWEVVLDEQNSTVVITLPQGQVTKYAASFGSSAITWTKSVVQNVNAYYSLDRITGSLSLTVGGIPNTGNCVVSQPPKDRLF
jgi:hypothetical protein